MSRLPARWEELAWPELRALDAERTVVLMPVGAIEQHGPHLPLSVDALVVGALAEAALARAEPGLPLLVLPVCPFGKSDEHVDYPGTLTLSAATLQALWSEIGASVARAGLKKLLILNGHGGQVATAQIVARDLRIRHRMLVASCLWPQLGLPEGILPADELRFGIHAGALETALVQAIRPELVRADRLARFEPTTRERAVLAPVLGGLGASGFGWMAQDLHPSGAAGDATLASAELGRKVLDHVTGRLLSLVRELRDQPLGDLGPGPLGKG
jgi:creatinine amidohydrolase